MISGGKFFLLLFFAGYAASLRAVSLPKRDAVLDVARTMLENHSVSYVLGGQKLGAPDQCAACNRCLDLKKPDKSERLSLCPVCESCSLDCSHFTFEVYKQSGLGAKYLTTAMMNALDPGTLVRDFYLVDVGADVERALPGDLLVYDGHVVMLERKHKDGTGDLIHVTSGKDLRGPGLGIQRERRRPLALFRGPLLRVLRHLDLVHELRAAYISEKKSRAAAP